jgi:hypothetical protein
LADDKLIKTASDYARKNRSEDCQKHKEYQHQERLKFKTEKDEQRLLLREKKQKGLMNLVKKASEIQHN